MKFAVVKNASEKGREKEGQRERERDREIGAKSEKVKMPVGTTQ